MGLSLGTITDRVMDLPVISFSFSHLITHNNHCHHSHKSLFRILHCWLNHLPDTQAVSKISFPSLSVSHHTPFHWWTRVEKWIWLLNKLCELGPTLTASTFIVMNPLPPLATFPQNTMTFLIQMVTSKAKLIHATPKSAFQAWKPNQIWQYRILDWE